MCPRNERKNSRIGNGYHSFAKKGITYLDTIDIYQAFKKVDLKSKIQMVEKRMKLEQIENENLHTEEVSFLKRTNLQLKRQIEEITSTKTST